MKTSEELQMEEILARADFEHRLLTTGIDDVLHGMLGSDEFTAHIQRDPIAMSLYQILKRTIRKNLELEKKLLEIKGK